MILNYILLFVASAIIFTLLIPKPQLEDARAQEFSEDGFPTATENAPIPYLVGRTRLNSPNTLFAGNFRTVPITEKVKTGLFSSKRIIVGYEYYLTLDLGFCLGDTLLGCTLHELIIDNQSVWTGTLNGDGDTFNIDEPNLFGGRKNGGGFVSTCRFYPGTFTQSTDAYIDALPDSGGLQTPYVGVAHIVFENAFIGESPQLRSISTIMSRYTNRLGLGGGTEIVGYGSNWAEALYDILVNQYGGLAADPDLLDTAEFISVAAIMATEGQGAAGVIQRATEGEAVIKEFLRQADALLTVDPISNLVQPFLLRKDYDPLTLPVFDNSQIREVTKFSQTLWAELVSEVKAGFKNPDNNFQDTTAVAQDLAVANTTGKLKSTNISLPFVKDSQLANDIVGRELNQLSQIVTQVTFKVNRTAYQLRAGSVFKWSWPDYGISEMILRTKDVKEGDDSDPLITVEAVRDTYDNTNNPFALPVLTGAQPIISTLVQITEYEFFSAPEFIVLQLSGNVDAGDFIEDVTVGYFHLLPVPPSGAISYDGIKRGDQDMFDEVEFPLRGTLNTAIAQFDNFSNMLIPSIELLNVDDPTRISLDGSGVRDGQRLIYINGEILAYTSYTDNGGGSVTLTNVYRAVLNTRQQDHAINDTVFFIDGSQTSIASSISTDTTDLVQLLPFNGITRLSLSDVTGFNLGTTNPAFARPDPPDYTQVQSSRTFDSPTDGQSITVTWRARDKSLGSVQLPSDASDTEPASTQYQVQLHNITGGGTLIYNSGLISGLSHTFNLPSSNVGNLLEIRVFAYRLSNYSLEYDPYRFTVVAPTINNLLLSGDEQSGGDNLLVSGDEQSGTDIIQLSGDEA